MEVKREKIEPLIARFEEAIKEFRAGRMKPEDFQKTRLWMGLYGQRQPNYFMQRIKIPFGEMNAAQARKLADVIEKWCPQGIAHATTRQDFQLHWMSLENAPTIQRELLEAGITTREACGHTVRNVVGCHLAGVCPTEEFDFRPYSEAIVDRFLNNPDFPSLPRKFKITFSGCATDCAFTVMNCIGARALRREKDGEIENGFRVTVGGGLGALPRLADTLMEFCPEGEFLAAVEAALRVFNRDGNRKRIMRARIKFLIEQIGIEEFKTRWRKEFDDILKNSPPAPVRPSAPNARPPRTGAPAPACDEPGFDSWLKHNVVAQRQAGYNAVQIHLPLGDVKGGQLRRIAGLAESMGDGMASVTIQQNLLIRYIKNEDLGATFKALKEIGLDGRAEGVTDTLACPGLETCGLALTNSRGVCADVSAHFAGRQDELQGVRVKANGCPNACAQHLAADFGLMGSVRTVDGVTSQYYQIYAGGNLSTKAQLAKNIKVDAPAEKVPQVLGALADLYVQNRDNGETFHDFFSRTSLSEFTRVGKAALKEG